MSPQQQDADNQHKSRPRAQTTSFPSLWRGTKRLDQNLSTLPPNPTITPLIMPLEDLIAALSPPSVPSLVHARALASAISTSSPLPRRATLNPVLLSLCDNNSPFALQAAGFDILSAYLENSEASVLTTSDRLAYFSLFLGSNVLWAKDLWEARFKALRALTKHGEDCIGIETSVVDLLKSWIESAFDGLFTLDLTVDRGERVERERSLEILVTLVSQVLNKTENIARFTDDASADILQFYAGLVDRSIVIPSDASSPEKSSTPTAESGAHNTMQGKPFGHRRNPSSLSTSSTPTSVSTVSTLPPLAPATRHPAEMAITLYLTHISTQIKYLSHVFLEDIIPLLFRALAFSSSPLPRLTMKSSSHGKATLLDKVEDTLNSLFLGPYKTKCMIMLKQYLFPPGDGNSGSSGTIQGNFVSIEKWSSVQLTIAVMTSLGAHRLLRNLVRRALSARLARALILREASAMHSPSGAPGDLALGAEYLEKAWPKDEMGTSLNGWDAGRMGKVLAGSVGAWIRLTFGAGTQREDTKITEGLEKILEEAAGLLRDILQELDYKEEQHAKLDDEEACAIGETLQALTGYITPLRNPDGTKYLVPLQQPSIAPTSLLRSLTFLLARDHARPFEPLLSLTLIEIADHLTDTDTARLPTLMLEREDLSPSSPEWLDNWEKLLGNPILVEEDRPATKRAIVDALVTVYDLLRDLPNYRRLLADALLSFSTRCPATDVNEDGSSVWTLLGDEIVYRVVEGVEGTFSLEDSSVTKFIDLLLAFALETANEEDSDTVDSASVLTIDTHSLSPTVGTAAPSVSVSPIMSRMQSDYHGTKEKDSGLPSVMSILTSLTTPGNTSRSQSIQPQEPDDPGGMDDTTIIPPTKRSVPRAVLSTCALISVFSQLTFTPHSLEKKNAIVAVRMYQYLLQVLSQSKSERARLTALQFLMRIRADRDHRLFYINKAYDADGLVTMLASLINRVTDNSMITPDERVVEEPLDLDSRKARPRMSQDKDGLQSARGRTTGLTSRSSRSRSRAPAFTLALAPATMARDPLWTIPEALDFHVSDADLPSESLVTYNPDNHSQLLALPISHFLGALLGILENDKSWEVVSYVLTHLPTQLANKHHFCGPLARELISKMLTFLCTRLINSELGAQIEHFPIGMKARDAQGLAYHTLSVLISYKRCFELKQRHLLVEVFQAGLNAQHSTIKCCLHALSLSAFDLQSSMTKCMTRILEKLSQIMSNPNMSVHILGFLSIIGSLPPLYANFTEGDYKMVFGVALQYLQHYNRNISPTTSWALSQHVRILSYTVVYVWFLALKLPDRPRHIPYITRQLLIANESNNQVDGPTEVCFDWLARYTYASADPRPTSSLFSEIITKVSATDSQNEAATSEKTWLLGNSVVTVRTLAREGWVEVLSRRPSGFSKFLCRVENVPLVGPGDVAPDLVSVPASLIMHREHSKVLSAGIPHEGSSEHSHVRSYFEPHSDPNLVPENPDPITGYVWSGSAPSQRRKQVAFDPSFLVLQLSSYPNAVSSSHIKIAEPTTLPKFFATLDRIPVIDTHKVGIMYVAPGQTTEAEILRNTHGSPAYTRFLEGLGRLINLRGQVDVYAGGLDPSEDGEYAYAWWDDIGQILYHTATMMPNRDDDPQFNNKKRHIGNDYVRIVWNDSGTPYRFDTLMTQFQFVNILIEPHSLGAIAAFSNNIHENEYFKVTVQRAPGMTEFAPVGHFKLISAENLPLLVRQLSLLADWFASVFAQTQRDTVRVEMKTNWHMRLESIRRLRNQMPLPGDLEPVVGVMGEESVRDFTTTF